MFLSPINLSHRLLVKEINEEYNPNEEVDENKFVEYIVDIPKGHEIYVLLDDNNIIGCGTVIIEKKMIHNFGKVAHIEDIFIRKEYRKMNYGTILINNLIEKANNQNCYKIILNCSEELQAFYAKYGFSKKNIQMAKYFSKV